MAYLLDANVFITAHRQWYGFDFCPGFWEWLRQAHGAGVVFSAGRVRSELDGDDALAEWVSELPPGFFLEESAADATAFGQVATWAQSQRYQPSAVSNFLRSADFALVAQALARQLAVVTLEVRSNTQRIIKIPDACAAVGVRYLTPYGMLREARVRLTLQPPTTLGRGPH